MNIEQDISLAQFTTLRVGGPADYFARATSEAELLKALAFAREKNLKTFLLGGGSNVLFADEGFRGMIIRNELTKIELGDDAVTVESGAALGLLLARAGKAGLSGLEALAGLPGTVGGAVAGNAGSYGTEIGDLVESAHVLTASGVQTVDRNWFEFEYRNSRLKQWSGDILISVTLKLQISDPKTVQDKMYATAKERALKEPGGATAGSFWKNPNHPHKAWELIDACELRGLQIGGASVAVEHANYLRNQGGATTADFLKLAERVEEAVMQTHGVRLEREVQVIPEL